MSTDNNNINYNAEEIQRYLQGKMTPREMYALEKASLDDEFLADAIEGYSLLPDENHSKVVAELKETITEKTAGGAKVVEMKGNWRQWYRIAAVLFIMLGSGAIIYKYVFTEKENLIQTIAEQKPVAVDSNKSLAVVNDSIKDIAANNSYKKDTGKIIAALTESHTKDESLKLIQQYNKRASDSIVYNRDVSAVAPAANAIAKNDEAVTKKADDYKLSESNDGIISRAPTVANKSARFKTTNQANGFGLTSNTQNSYNNYTTNIFKGKIVDNKNEPLPFARIAIKNDSFKIATYADVKGNFSFVAPDSVLDVDIMSVGFANNNYRLQRGLLGENKITMKESSEPLAEVVVTKSTGAKRKSMMDIMKDSTNYAEPEDGWENYDTYIANNLLLPQQTKLSNVHGSIELSFSVDKNGNPQNISVDKSLGNYLDKEAVKAIKEGPRWKSKKRKAKGKIVLKF